MQTGRLTDLETFTKFALAGNARLTLVSGRTGARFTYRVQRAKAKQAGEAAPSLWFVSVLTGSDNDGDFSYLGTLAPKQGSVCFKYGRKSRIGEDAPSSKAFSWAWLNLVVLPESYGEAALEKLEIWHEGRCGRCGRTLTVPSSIETGLGPDCAGKV